MAKRKKIKVPAITGSEIIINSRRFSFNRPCMIYAITEDILPNDECAALAEFICGRPFRIETDIENTEYMGFLTLELITRDTTADQLAHAINEYFKQR